MTFSVCLISKEKMDQFLYHLNKVHSSVSFSKGVEANGQRHIWMFYWQTPRLELKQLSVGKALIHVCTINGKACLQYNMNKCDSKFITSFLRNLQLFNWSTKSFKILNPIFLAMDSRTRLWTSKFKYFSTKVIKIILKTSKKSLQLLEEFFCICPTLVKHH